MNDKTTDNQKAEEIALSQLSNEEQALIAEIGLLPEFTESTLEPRLLDSAERQSFYASPTAYLIELGTPLVADFSAEQTASYDDLARALLDEADAKNIGCTICRVAVGIAIVAIIAVGFIIAAATISALGVAMAKFTGSLSIALAAVAFAGLKLGVRVIVPHIDTLANRICVVTNACPA